MDLLQGIAQIQVEQSGPIAPNFANYITTGLSNLEIWAIPRIVSVSTFPFPLTGNYSANFWIFIFQLHYLLTNTLDKSRLNVSPSIK